MKRVLAILAVGIGAAVVLVVVVLVVVIAAGLFVERAALPDDVRAEPPLARLRVTRRHGQVTTIDATLDGTRIEAVVNLRILDGIEPYTTPNALERRLGVPSGLWKVPPPKASAPGGLFGSRTSDRPAPYYDRPDGRVTLRPFPTPEQGLNWNPVAFPDHCTLEYLFSDTRFRKQVEALLPAGGMVSLTIRGAEGWVALAPRASCRCVQAADLPPRFVRIRRGSRAE
jgi:hypothetical protein